MRHAGKVTGAIAWTEMLIGVTTVGALSASVVMSAQHKPVNVFWFVIVTAWVSFGLGLGIMLRKEWARLLLVFFSGYVILTKALIFAGLMQFGGEIMTMVPPDVKNLVSVAYHLFVMGYLTRQAVKREFR